jgi:hypothetical protein
VRFKIGSVGSLTDCERLGTQEQRGIYSQAGIAAC